MWSLNRTKTSVVMVLVRHFLKFRNIHHFRKLIEVEHRVVLAVLAEESNVLAEVHILEVIRDEAPVAPLHALPEFPQNLFVICYSHYAIVDFNTQVFPALGLQWPPGYVFNITSRCGKPRSTSITTIITCTIPGA
jgi:acetate kinase